MLILVATPIGNLGDLSFRAVEVLKESEIILCEDTRHSRKLLNHYQIQKRLISYHQFNEAARQEKILERLHRGEQIALISDAGTPSISDPGSRLVTACIEQEIPVTAIPGACAAIQALICSGLSTEKFQFVGFLPRRQGRLTKQLEEILLYPGTTICYESPKRLLKVLPIIQTLAPDRLLVVARELTKRFEEFYRGIAAEQIKHWTQKTPKGEIVLLIQAKN